MDKVHVIFAGTKGTTDETFITLGSVIRDRTFIKLGSKWYYRWDLSVITPCTYYTWVTSTTMVSRLTRVD